MYKPLDIDSVVDYVRNQPAAKAHLDTHGTLEAREVGDGNLNLVFKIYNQNQQSLLIKQALPYVRAAGESWPLSLERATFEARALELSHRVAPERVPQPYWFDETLMLNAMENLDDYHVIRFPMMQGEQYPHLGATIGDFLARTLAATSDFALDSAEKRQLTCQFINTELCQISEDLIFTEPYLSYAPRNHWNPRIEPEVRSFQQDDTLKTEAARLKYRFMTATQALLHGDLHTGSIMANDPMANDPVVNNHDIRVIDPEFAFFGPMGFDIGVFIGNLFLNAAAHEIHTPDAQRRHDYRRYLLGEAKAAWTTFEQGFRARLEQANSPSWRAVDFQAAFIQSVLQDTAGYAGAEMLRRVVGFAHVADLDAIEDLDERARAERMAIHIGRTLVLEHQHISTFDSITAGVADALGIDHV